MFRSLSMPSRKVPPASPTQQQARRSDGELCFEMKNETGWLANVTESTFCPGTLATLDILIYNLW